MKIAEAYNRYRDDCLIAKGRANRTIIQYESLRNVAVRFFQDQEISTIAMADVSSYIRWLREEREHNTVLGHVVALKLAFRHAKLLGENCLNPDLIPLGKKEDVTVEYVTPEEVVELINACRSPRQKVIISLLFSSGIRVSELCNLKIADLDRHSFRVKGKGNKIRVCFIDGRTKQLIEDYLRTRHDTSPYLIATPWHNHSASPSLIRREVERVRQKAGLMKKITPHAFRHGFATDLLENGAAIQDVSQMLGHSSVQTTMIYRHVTDPGLWGKYKKAHSS